MALVGFPEQISVTLGSAWSGLNGLDPDDVLILTKVTGQDSWSENGTTSPNAATNRIRLLFNNFQQTYGPSTAYNINECIIYGTNSFGTSGICWGLTGGSPTTVPTDYPFLQVWNAPQRTIIPSGLFNSAFNNSLGTQEQIYNTEIFPSMSAYSATSLQVLDGETIIADGETTPIDFGTALEGASALSKTFTVENIGAGTITVSDVTVPSGYTITQNIVGSIGASSSADLIVSLPTSSAGTFSGDITITSDDGASPYNFAITGEITDNIIPNTIPSNVNFGTTTIVPGAVDISANTITSGVLFGATTIDVGAVNVSANTITSGVSFGITTVTNHGPASDDIGVTCVDENNNKVIRGTRCFYPECPSWHVNCDATPAYLPAITVCNLQSYLPLTGTTCPNNDGLIPAAPKSAARLAREKKYKAALSRLKLQ